MKCREIDLQDYVYRFLGPHETAAVRDHVAGCGSCRGVLRRLEAEKDVLARAALRPARAWKSSLVSTLPVAFAAALLIGLFWLLFPKAPPQPAAVSYAAPVLQDKKEKVSDEASLQDQIATLQKALETAADEKEKGRIKKSLGDLQLQLERLKSGKDEKTASKEPMKKPGVKGKLDPAEERINKAKMELEAVYLKIKMSKDPEERAKLEMRVQELNQDLKLLSQGERKEINIKEVELRLQADPKNVDALVERATWYLDNGKAPPALKDLDQAIELKPDCAPAHLKRAIAHAFMGDQAKAWQDAKRGEELDLKAGKMIDETFRTLKKLTAPKERRTTANEIGTQIATLQERLDELKSMAANADLAEAERDRARREADRVAAEISRLQIEQKSAPAESENKKIDKKK